MKKIIIELEGLEPEELEDVNISFRDGRDYITKTDYEFKEDGTRITHTVTEPV